MSKTTLQSIISLLKKKNISFKHIQHATIDKSSAIASKIRGTNLNQGAKALILKGKSGKIFQIVLPANRKADLKSIKKIVEEKNVSLVSPDEVKALTDCIVGSVPPFGVLWKIPLYADRKLLGKKEIVFSAGTLNDSIFIAPKELIACNNASIVDLSKEKEN